VSIELRFYNEKKISKQNEDAQNLAVTNRLDVKPALITDSENKRSYQEWQKRTAADLFIKEALNVTIDMIK